MADNSLIRSALNTSLSLTSLDDLVRVRTSAVRFLVCDCSGSMSSFVTGDRRRIDALREVVRNVREKADARVIVFDGQGARLGDKPTEPYGGTPLHEGIAMAKVHGASACVVISDGEPDSETRAMEAAQAFGGRIDVVYVGAEGDYGRLFLRRLAEATGGTESTGDLANVDETTRGIVGLLSSGAEQQSAVINLGAPVEDDDEDDEDEDVTEDGDDDIPDADED
jgi:hypothetical protein